MVVDRSFKYQPYICNGCHDFIQKAMSIIYKNE